MNLPTKPNLPDLYSPTAVAELVDAPLRRLNWWAWIAPDSKRYTHFEIAKRDGFKRPIAAPVPSLKKIQRRIAAPLTAAYRAPAHVHGFTHERSPQTNAAVHVGQRWVFSIDIADFFGSVTFARVRGLFMAFPFGYPEPVAELLARLCCHRDVLPQGAPTSPVITNYICRAMDRDLAKLAIANGCYYTRYADDMVFSTDRTLLPEGIATHISGRATPSSELAMTIAGAGFRINEAKTRLQICYARQRVTGLVVNQKVNVPRSYIRGLRAVLHIWRAHGEVEASRSLRHASPDPNWPPGKARPSLSAVVRGRIDYIGSVRGRGDPTYLGLLSKLRERDPSVSLPTNLPNTARRARLFTEGPTDAKHIAAALAYFHGRGDFTNITLEIDEETPRGSDQQLREHLERIVQFSKEGLAVGVFDWDSRVSKDAVAKDGWQPYGDRVAAVGLAHPSFRDEEEPLCIELLYPDDVLETEDDAGRRIYRVDEFDSTTSIHKRKPCVVPHAGKDKKHLIASDVFEVGTNAQLARSKMSFALAVESSPQDFPTLTFEGFRPTFERLAVALGALEPSEPA